MSWLLPGSEAKAIHWPSGDQAGWPSLAGSLVRRLLIPPAPTVKMSRLPSGVFATYASIPAGDQAGIMPSVAGPTGAPSGLIKTAPPSAWDPTPSLPTGLGAPPPQAAPARITMATVHAKSRKFHT